MKALALFYCLTDERCFPTAFTFNIAKLAIQIRFKDNYVFPPRANNGSRSLAYFGIPRRQILYIMRYLIAEILLWV